jgi:hypothetical protein
MVQERECGDLRRTWRHKLPPEAMNTNPAWLLYGYFVNLGLEKSQESQRGEKRTRQKRHIHTQCLYLLSFECGLASV